MSDRVKYDDKIPDEKLEPWKELISEAVKSSSLCFPRWVIPVGALGQPFVVGFEDGAKSAYSGNIYLQWKIPCSHGLSECDQDYDSNMIWGKAIVTPLSGYSTPRSELSGMVLVSRMALTTVKASQTGLGRYIGGSTKMLIITFLPYLSTSTIFRENQHQQRMRKSTINNSKYQNIFF